MKIVSYILFPTKISKDTIVSVVAGDNICLIDIEKDNKYVSLDLKEAKQIAKIVDSIKGTKK